MEKMGCILHGRLQPIGFPARWMPLPWQKLSCNSVRDVTNYAKTLEETEQRWMLLVDYSTRSMELSPGSQVDQIRQSVGEHWVLSAADLSMGTENPECMLCLRLCCYSSRMSERWGQSC